MSTDITPGAAPVTSAERIGELDALRGFALLGVLLANLFWFAITYWSVPVEQMRATFDNEANLPVIFGIEWLVADKANTMFATLFGIGFWVQMQRIKEKGAAFSSVYIRRLMILMAMGLINLLLIWPWDILFIYSFAGLLLYSLRNISARSMLILGLILVFARPVLGELTEIIGLEAIGDQMFTEAASAQRHAVFVSGTYGEWVGEAYKLFLIGGIKSGALATWVFYALGRFLLGAYIARQGWLMMASDLQPQFRKALMVFLPLGLLGEGLRAAEVFGDGMVSSMVHGFTSLILAYGYGIALIVLFNSKKLKPLASVFAPVGRMALTNYLVQGFFIGFLLYGFHGGLALAGSLEPITTIYLAFGFFAVQIMFSFAWLSQFRFGPMEWLWRALTYGERPAMRKLAAS